MTTVRDDQSLSRLELVVLARLSATKPPSEAKLGQDVAALVSLDSPAQTAAQARDVVNTTLPALRKRALVNDRKLTENGKRALRTAFGLEQTPTWAEAHTTHLPALSLGLKIGSADAGKVVKTKASILMHLLCTHLGVSKGGSLDAVCDVLIMQAFAIPHGPLTLKRIRAYALAAKSPKPVNPDSKRSAAKVAEDIGQQLLGSERTDKKTVVRALTRNWLYAVSATGGVRTALPGPRALDLQPPHLPIEPKPPVTGVITTSADALLTLVREAIPRIGSDGRFGTEKVFVSAIWHRIESDNRLPDLSLDRFKRWLVTANRDQLLDLARADLVGAMDPKLVRESEIEDLGATFHFVVDRRANGTGQGHHAR
jgi:hypothetical protein